MVPNQLNSVWTVQKEIRRHPKLNTGQESYHVNDGYTEGNMRKYPFFIGPHKGGHQRLYYQAHTCAYHTPICSVLPNIYNAHFGKAAQHGLGSALIILTGRPVSGMKVAHLSALPRSGLGSCPWRNLWRRWPHTSLGDTGPRQQRPSDYTGRGTKHRGKYR